MGNNCIYHRIRFNSRQYNTFYIHGIACCFYFFLFLASSSCKKEDSAPAVPLLFTGEIVNITEEGAEFTGNFKNINPDKVVSYGFVLLEPGDEKVKSSRHISLPLPFANEVVKTKSYSLKKDVIYEVQTFVTYPGKTYYGNLVSFLSLGSRAPVIDDLNTNKINFGDTITIGVSYIDVGAANIKIMFNNEEGEILDYTDSLISVKVPYFTEVNSFFTDGKANLYLKKLNFHSDTTLLEVLPPEIYGTIPTEGYSASELVINGRGFHPDLGQLILGSYELNKISTTSKAIKVHLPPLYENYNGELKYSLKLKKGKTHNLSYKLGDFKILAPSISHFNKDSIFYQDTLIVYGNYLDNNYLDFIFEGRYGNSGFGTVASVISRTKDSIVLQVPERICTNSVRFSYFFNGVPDVVYDYYTYIRTFMIKEPDDISIQVENDVSGYPYKRVVISSRYFPNANFTAYQNEIRVIAQSNISPPGMTSNLFVNASTSAIIPDGWVHLDLHFCETSYLKLDSVFQVPAPVIEEITDTVKTTNEFIIKGNYFNEKEWLNQVLIDGESIGNYRAQNPNEIEVDLDLELETGLHDLQIVTNGQVSNTISIYLVNPWQKITNTPGYLGNMPIAFFLNDKFYVGGGVHSRDYNFYEYDLNTKNWTKKGDLPVYEGATFNDNNYCLLSHFNDLYQYFPESDQWVKKSSIPVDLGPNIEYPCFMHDGHFFVFKAHYKEYHIYNITENSWQNVSSNIKLDIFSSVALNKDTAWFLMDNGAYIYDLNKQQFVTENLNPSLPKSNLQSINGFEYKHDLYFFNDGQWMIYDKVNFNRRRKMAPRSFTDYTKIFRQGNIAYVIMNNSIWKCNLDQL